MANNYNDYAIIRVTPTLTTGAYSDGDVLFTATEIPNAVRGNNGCSKLVNCFVLDQHKQTFDAHLVFSEANTALGTRHATADISDADIEAMGICGSVFVQHDVGAVADLDTSRIIQAQNMTGAGESYTPILLQAGQDSTSVYVSAVISDGTPNFNATDDLDIILHIQYK